MSPERYEQLWNDLILDAINRYISRNNEYYLAVNKEKLKENIRTAYEKDYKPQFKNICMFENFKHDLENEDEVPINGGKSVKIDRHKVAALLYLAIIYNDSKPFIRVKGKPDSNNIVSILACHEIAYSVCLSCIHSFIEEGNKQNPDVRKANFLKNGGFKKTPPLICEEYNDYRDSIIPRMVWAMETNDNKPSKQVSTNVNMLSNIFYFLELHSLS